MGEVKKFLTAAEILESDDIRPVEIDVPEWGGVVRLRPLTAEESVRYTDLVKTGDKRHGAVILAAMSIVDEDGKQAFTEDQAKALTKKSLAALMRIQRTALRINGLTDEEVKAATKD